MLKRLLVLAAALAALLVFAPTSSAQDSGVPDVPTECEGVTSSPIPEECRASLQQLLDPVDTVGDLLLPGGGDPAGLPKSCQEILDLRLEGTATTEQLLGLLACLSDLADLGGGETDQGGEPEGEAQRQPTTDLPVDDIGAEEGIGADEGNIPDGGVDSGFGPTDSDESGTPLAATGAALLALLGVLATGLVMMRRRRSGS